MTRCCYFMVFSFTVLTLKCGVLRGHYFYISPRLMTPQNVQYIRPNSENVSNILSFVCLYELVTCVLSVTLVRTPGELCQNDVRTTQVFFLERPHLLQRRCLTSHPLCLFVSICLFVHLVGCCIIALPLVVVATPRRSLHLISCHPSRLVVVELSRHRIVASCLASSCLASSLYCTL
jgi:hypothetical protein